MVDLPDDAIEAAKVAVICAARAAYLPLDQAAAVAVAAAEPVIAARVRAEALGASADVSVDAVRAAAAALVRWCDDPAGSPTVLGSILAPLVPAVHAEAVADALDQMRAHADDESLKPEALWRQVDRQWSARYRADVRSRDQAIPQAVAAERQRIAAALNDYAEHLEANTRESADLIAGHRHAALLIGGMAAGSVPVATPPANAAKSAGDLIRERCCPDCGYFLDSDAHERTCGPVATPELPALGHDAECENTPPRHGTHHCGCRRRRVLRQSTPGPVATPTEAAAADQVEAARAEQALVQRVLDAHDEELGTGHGLAYRAMIADHWRLIETFEPHRTAASPVPAETMSGAGLIASERRRQVEVEGWTPEHDDQHGGDALRAAADCYRRGDSFRWPWAAEWWKPKGRARDLIRAGALYLAAIESYERTGTTIWASPRTNVAGVIGQCRQHITAITADIDSWIALLYQSVPTGQEASGGAAE